MLLEATTRCEVLALALRLTAIDPGQPDQSLRHIAAITSALQDANQPLERRADTTAPATGSPPTDDPRTGRQRGRQKSCAHPTPAKGTDDRADMHPDLAHAAVLGAADHPPGSRVQLLAVVRG
jgi:hypothetical protein